MPINKNERNYLNKERKTIFEDIKDLRSTMSQHNMQKFNNY